MTVPRYFAGSEGMVGATSKDPQVNTPEGALDQIVRIVRRRKWVVLQALVAIPLLALVFSLTQEEEYTATATLLFRQVAEGPEGGTVIDPTREAATNSQLVGLPIVSERTARTLGGQMTTAEITASVTVDADPDADTAEIAATTDSPELSADLANAYGRAYIDFRRQADRAQVQDAINVAEFSLEALTPEEREGPQGTALNEQLDRLKLTQALQTGGAELVQPASPPTSPSSPKPVRNTVLGLLLGALVGFCLAALLDRIDRRVRTVEELEDLYGLPVLARIPRSRKLSDRSLETMGPQTQEGEAFRVLRRNLRYFNVGRDLNTILITSPEAGDGKSTVAQGLATTMAEMGDEVVLVETDLRKGGLSGVKGPATGLSNVLTGMPLQKALVRVRLSQQGMGSKRDLAVLPSGPTPPNPSELLESARMQELLAGLKEEFEIVLLDSPALGAVSDALSLIPEVSGVVVVGGLGATTRDAAEELSKQLALMQERPLGVIANFTEPESGKYSHYYRGDPASGPTPSS